MFREKGPSLIFWALSTFFSFNFLYGKISISIAPSSLNLNLKTGILYNSQIQVLNDGDVDYDVFVSFYDLGQNKDGDFYKIEVSNYERGAGKWLSSDLKNFRLKKGEKIFFKYYIDVPKDVSGSFAGAIMFNLKTPKFQQEFGASIEVGIASKIFITISESKEEKFNFKEFKTIKDEKGDYYAVLSVENPTEVFSYISGNIFIKNEGGEEVFEKKIESDRPIFPKNEINLKYKIENIISGNYIGVLLLNQKNLSPIIKTIYFKVEKYER